MQRNKRLRKFCFILFMLFAVCPAYCSTYFVATNGSDSNSGTTIDDPFLTIPHAVGLVVGGDTIYVRGGTYTYSGSSIAITLNAKSGASDVNRCYLMGYNDERPLLDCSAMTGTGADCIKITTGGNYWYVKGLDIKGAARNGINLNGGSYNIVEFCSTYENRSAGVQIQNGSAYNQIINCDSYYNYDVCSSPPGKNADGFSPKTDVGTGNYFYGCRSWQNSDDGYDGYLDGADDVNTTYENCWAFKNGWYWLDGSTNDKMNGNGFKMGGNNLRHNVILKNCLSFQNKAKGFDQNHNRGDMTLYNCTAFSNGGNNYSIYETLASGKTATVTNCVNLTGGVNLLADGNVVVQTTNSWMSPFDVNDADFASIDANAAYGPRKADGSLPDITFMHLAHGSDLIDGGTDVNLPYNGRAPDLGAFEYTGDNCHIDGQTDLADLACLATYWLDSECGNCNEADLNDDHNVNFLDFAIMAENWLK
jgi:hypothetical protein